MDSTELSLQDVFVFADGRTVFVGILSRPVSGVPTRAELVVEGGVVAAFEVNVEMPLHPDKRALFSVSTAASFSFNPIELPMEISRLVIYVRPPIADPSSVC
jgi:hypothetical protein